MCVYMCTSVCKNFCPGPCRYIMWVWGLDIEFGELGVGVQGLGCGVFLCKLGARVGSPIAT